MMGPSATQVLAEMGADVIKVEAPGGDPVRYIGPARHHGMGALFLNANGSKRFHRHRPEERGRQARPPEAL
jgi:crotonobetainyl-CoA:carnitine CoA-transferase CaiB-like acyl-CoA transferase